MRATWIDKSSVFRARDDRGRPSIIRYGEELPSSVSDRRLEQLAAMGKVDLRKPGRPAKKTEQKETAPAKPSESDSGELV